MSRIINFGAPGLKLHRALTSPVLKFQHVYLCRLQSRGMFVIVKSSTRVYLDLDPLFFIKLEIYKPRENRLAPMVFESILKKIYFTYHEEHLFQVVLQILSRPVRRPPRYIKIDRNVLERYRVKIILKKGKYKNWSTRVSRSFSFSSTVHVTTPDVEWGRTPPSSQVDVQRLTVES